ncbi:MAG TPA: DUF4832 domain-containing protein [Chitinophagaceae bacterium]
MLLFTYATNCSEVEKPSLYYPPLTDTLVYTESNEDFANPERGFYRPLETNANNFVPLDVNQMKTWRTLQQVGNSQYKVYSTLVYRGYILEGFTGKPLTQAFLHNVQKDFDNARAAGVKLIGRFAYTIKTHSGSCAEHSICPPYGDAPKEIVLTHIMQLKPLLEQNADVIACMQLGFIGIWGENYYTDFFGDASKNGKGKLIDKNWQDRFDVLKALLGALPQNRMIQVRIPQTKQRYVYGVHAGTNASALTDAEAFTGTDKARIGFHNDCFLSSPDDYGTYYDYGNSSSPGQSALTPLRTYMMDDSRYVPVGGETCDDAYSPENNCEPEGHAQTEMRSMHYSFLNCAYNNDVNNDWESGRCMNEIKKDLGYRFVLRNTIYPVANAKAGKQLTFTVNLENVGYASPYNARPARIIMRNTQSNEIFSFDINTDVRKWFSGKVSLNIKIVLPANMHEADYEILMFLPDGFPSIAARPEYAIRFANENMWEEKTGYNKLGFKIHVQ